MYNNKLVIQYGNHVIYTMYNIYNWNEYTMNIQEKKNYITVLRI